MFQQFNLIPSLSARENVVVPLSLAGVRRREAVPRALERRGSRWRATRYDRYARTTDAITTSGAVRVTVRDSRTASLIARHVLAVRAYLGDREDASVLAPFRGRSFRAGGRTYVLETDPATLDPIEVASRDEITALQLTRLRWSLQHAYDRVPHTRAAFDAAGVAPGDLSELADLRNFPFTTKEDLRATYPYGMLAVPRDQVRRIHASSAFSRSFRTTW